MLGRERDDSGAAALEFALVFPILVLVLLGIINFGVVFAQQLALENAARQAARYAAVEGHDCEEIEEHAQGSAGTIAMSAMPKPEVRRVTSATSTETCPGTPPCVDSADGDDVEVTMTHQSKFLVPMPIPGFGDGVEITGEGTFRCEFS